MANMGYEEELNGAYLLAVLALGGNLAIEAIFPLDGYKNVISAAFTMLVGMTLLELPKRIYMVFINNEKYWMYRVYSLVAYAVFIAIVVLLEENHVFAMLPAMFGIISMTKLYGSYIEIARTGYAGLDLE